MRSTRCVLRLTDQEAKTLETLSKELGISKSAVLRQNLHGASASIDAYAAFATYMNICRLLENKDYDAVAKEVFSLCGLFNSLTSPKK